MLSSWNRFAVSLATLGHGVSALSPPDSASIPSRLWASSPATYWNDSFVIGNGRLGAVVPGSPATDVVHLNEDSFWAGGELHRVNPDAATHMPVMQSYIRNGEIPNAATLASYAYAGTPVSCQHYDPLGDLTLNMNHSATVTNYQRWLDLADGTTGVYYSVNGVNYMRELLASEPDGVLAMRLVADKPGALSFNIHLDRGESLNRWEDYTTKVGDDTTVMGGGSGGGNAILFAAGATVKATGGKVYTIGDYVVCQNCTEAWVYLQSWTSFRKSNPRQAVLSDLSSIGGKPYSSIRAAHVADYQHYANRTSLSLGASTAAQKKQTTSQRLTAMMDGAFDPEIASLYFQFGRYLLIATSRAGTLPPNLQGIWNSDLDPEWGSKYTININLEMNYWHSLVTNLADLNGPLYDLIEKMRQTGTTTARTMYNVSGAVAHHNTDCYGDTAPQDNYPSSTFWSSGFTWLVTHIMQDYLFTGNKTLLQEKLTTMEQAAEFYVGFLTDYKGWKVTNPSLSPENVYYMPNSTVQESITAGPTIDNSLIWELIGQLTEAGKALGTEGNSSLMMQLDNIRAQLPPIRVSYFGGVQEWIEDYKETDPGHRHFSPLWGLYPGTLITASNATSFDAAKTTLMRRLSSGGGDTGWSRAWSISLAARTFMADQVHASLLQQLANYTYPNSMLDTGPPAAFQIDGNFGAPAGIAEALVQSHELVESGSKKTASSGKDLTPSFLGDSKQSVPLIRLLPATPPEWGSNGGGSVKGLRARGVYEVEIHWDAKAQLKTASLTSLDGNAAWLTVGSEPVGQHAAKTNSTGDAIKVGGVGGGRFVLLPKSKPGKVYQVTLA